MTEFTVAVSFIVVAIDSIIFWPFAHAAIRTSRMEALKYSLQLQTIFVCFCWAAIIGLSFAQQFEKPSEGSNNVILFSAGLNPVLCTWIGTRMLKNRNSLMRKSFILWCGLLSTLGILFLAVTLTRDFFAFPLP